MEGRRNAVTLTKEDFVAMTSLFLPPGGHELSHTKSEAVKVTRENTKYKFHIHEPTPVILLNILNFVISIRHLVIKCYFCSLH